MDYIKKRAEGTPLGELKTYSIFKGMSHAEKTRKLQTILKEVANAMSDLDPYRKQMAYDAGTLFGMKFMKEGRLIIRASEKVRDAMDILEGLETRLEQIIEKME